MQKTFDAVGIVMFNAMLSVLGAAVTLFLYLLLVDQLAKISGHRFHHGAFAGAFLLWLPVGFCLALAVAPHILWKYQIHAALRALAISIAIVLMAPMWFLFAATAVCGFLGDCL